MMLDFYGLREQPFGVAPDPRFLYLSPTHREALASLAYGVESGRGFLALIAPPGMGKTTLLFHVLERAGASARTVFLFRNPADHREMLEAVMADLEIEAEGRSVAWMSERLNEVLVEEAKQGRRFILIIDEAQNLSQSVLESVRQWSNFETPTAKLMQIILAGQPSLADRLMDPWLAQLRQRISVIARLEPLTGREIEEYIDFRLRAAGYEGRPFFSRKAIEQIVLQSRGIPRNVNNLCFHALSLGYAQQRKKIDEEVVLEAARDTDLLPLTTEKHRAALEAVVLEKQESSVSHLARAEGGSSWVRPIEAARSSWSRYGIGAALLALLIGSFWVGRHGFNRKVLESLSASARQTAVPPASEAKNGSAASSKENASTNPTAQQGDQARQASKAANGEQSSAETASRGAAPNNAPAADAPASNPGQESALEPIPGYSDSGIDKQEPPGDEASGENGAAEELPSVRSERKTSEVKPQRSRTTVKTSDSFKPERKRRSAAAARATLRPAGFKPSPATYHAATSSTGEISISTTPPGLMVLIDGQAAGRSPVQRLLSVGKHTYRVVPPSGGAAGDGTFEVRPAALVRISLTWPTPNAIGPAGGASSVESAAR